MKSNETKTEPTILPEETEAKTVSRRGVIGAGAALGAAASLAPNPAAASRFGRRGRGGVDAHPIFGARPLQRSLAAAEVRFAAAKSYVGKFIGQQRTNGDEGLYPDFRASFTKALPHDAQGLVDGRAYRQLLDALKSGQSSDFEQVPMAGDRRLVNPQAAYRFELTGRDGAATFMRPAPAYAGAETAAEMGEVYWKALCRDVPFADFETSPLIAAAVNDLNAFSETVGPKEGDAVTVRTVFRGDTPGDLEGPYISQFLIKDVPYGNSTIVQRYDTPAPGDDFMTTFGDWLDVQRGLYPPELVKGNPRYISNARALGEYVHVDSTYQAYLSAALILLDMPGAFDAANPYNSSPSQEGFATFGTGDVLDLVAKASNLALTGAWYQKWLVHRRLRPETYGGRLHKQLADGVDMGLPDEIANSDAISRIFSRNGTYLLPMAFPEGSPTHPSYPAGHAAMAGACCTVLKAFFDEDKSIDSPVVPDATGTSLLPYFGTLTIGGEINKLANNIALGRDWAGVHYRSDGVDGLLVGEQQALGLLADYSRTYNERFDGFSLTTFDGRKILIRNGLMR
ncbi:MAG: vanadium-dependent haloperoxidase [Pseudomonadota bacterium]